MAQVAQHIRHTLKDALALCGVLTDTDNIQFNEANAAARITAGVFNDNYSTCMDLSITNLEDDWKTYCTLTVAEDKIRLTSRTKANIKALLQCVRDRIRSGENPADDTFPVNDCFDLMERFNTHKQWMKDAEGMVKSAMPKEFDEKMNWADWNGTFINFLKSQPGRHGVPLSYVVRKKTFL
jgi:hypothetical protein